MKNFQFNINESGATAILTVKANDQQTAVKQAEKLLKTTNSLSDPQEVTDEQQRYGEPA